MRIRCSDCEQTITIDGSTSLTKVMDDHDKEHHPEKLAEKRRAYYEENKDEIAEKQRAYREENKDEIAEKRRAYYEENKDELAEVAS